MTSTDRYKSIGDRFVTPSAHVPVQFMADSYASWAHKKQASEGKFRLVGIEHVFPQDFAKETPALPQLVGGSRSAQRRWKILKASELIR